MNKRSSQLLDFESLYSIIENLHYSAEGKELLQTQTIITDANEYDLMHDNVEAAVTLLERGEGPPSFYFPPLSDLLKRVVVAGSILEGEELRDIAYYIDASHCFKKYFLTKKQPNDHELIDRFLHNVVKIPDMLFLTKEINKIINQKGEIREDHPELLHLRRNLTKLNQDINNRAAKHLQERREIYQTDVPTQKDGRIVLPLKSNYKGSIHGIVYDVSAKGSTLYIEPYDVLELNNRITMVHHEIRQVQIRILRELSQKVRVYIDDLNYLIKEVATIDTIIARALFAIGNNCNRVFRTGEHKVELKQARHPMLEIRTGQSLPDEQIIEQYTEQSEVQPVEQYTKLQANVVPIDITIPKNSQTLIITGPNAGGKTVTLKTLGLFVLMNQFGIPLPVEEGSTLSLFKQVFVDIGDDQSIEKSLSTFSGHMQSISSILQHSNQNALVLLDELGSGTDPLEGGAIAMALLDAFREKGSTVVVTSHHSVLKNYGYTVPGVLNASMEFDNTTLKPTFRVIPGIPGDSHALDIASSNGIPDFVLHIAKNYLKGEGNTIAERIQELEKKEHAIQKREKELLIIKKELAEKARQADRYYLQIKQKETELQEHGYIELKSYLYESRKKLENLVKSIREEELDKNKTKQVKKFIKSLEEKEQFEHTELKKSQLELSENSNNEPQGKDSLYRFSDKEQTHYYLSKNKFLANTNTTKHQELKPGMQVLIKANNSIGTLVRKEKKASWLVAVGAVKMVIDENQLTVTAFNNKCHGSAKINRNSDSNYGKHGPVDSFHATGALSFSYQHVLQDNTPDYSLDLRGMRLEEALQKVQTQIDRAVLTGLHEFSIIHGTGEGILQQGIREFLSSCPHVERYNYSPPETGGFGRTMIRMKG